MNTLYRPRQKVRTTPRPNRQVSLLLQRIRELESEMAVLRPKAEYCDKVLLATNTVPTGEIGELFGLSARKVNEILKEEGIIYKVGKRWRLKGKYKKMGLAYPATHSVKKNVNEGSYRAFSHLRWTQKGVMFCYNLLTEKGCTPLKKTP